MKPNDPNPELIKAVSRGDAVRVRQLLDQGANPNGINAVGKTLLMGALNDKYMDVAELLVAKGALPDAQDTIGHTALIYAVAAKQTDTMQWLLDKGAGVNEANGFGVTPLMSAAHTGKPESIRLLIDRGADMDRVSNNGKTVFNWAEGSAQPGIPQLLRDIVAEKKAQAERLEQERKKRIQAEHDTAIAKQRRLNRLTPGKIRLRFGS